MSKRNESMFETMLKAPWWAGISLAAVFYIAVIIIENIQFGLIPGKGIAPLFKFLAIPFALAGILSFIISLFKGRLLDKTNSLEDIKNISWREFEFLVGEYYRRKGYSVSEMGGASADGGIDLLFSYQKCEQICNTM